MGLFDRLRRRGNPSEPSLAYKRERAQQMREAQKTRLEALRKLALEGGNEETAEYAKERLKTMENLTMEAEVLRLNRRRSR